MPWITTEDTWLTEAESLSNAQLVADHFAATWSKEAICALCGNMRHESSLNPNIWEFGYGHSLSRGYGLVQWTPASKYIDWATAAGLDWTLGDSQLARIDFEADQSIQWIANGYQLRYGNSTPKYDFSFAEFRSNSVGLDVPSLTEAFMWNYEGPSFTAGNDSLAGRQAFAQTCLTTLTFNGAPPPTPATTTNKIYHLWLCGALEGGI